MAIITITDVKDFLDTGSSDNAIQLLINLVDGADACLTTLGATSIQSKAVKVYGVCAMLQENAGGGISSQSSFTGDSVTYGGKEGALPNQWLKGLQGMVGGQCVLAAIGHGGTYPATMKRA